MTTWKTREPGFYWVNLPEEGGWQPAEWQSRDWDPHMGKWLIIDSEYTLDDDDFAEIGERIERNG